MWLTVKEVAELFDTSDRTIQRRIKDFAKVKNMYSAAQKEKAEAESSMKYC